MKRFYYDVYIQYDSELEYSHSYTNKHDLDEMLADFKKHEFPYAYEIKTSSRNSNIKKQIN